MEIPAKIKQLTDEKGWTEYRLVKESKLPASTIANIFHRGTIPSIPTLEAICQTFGITLSQFFSDKDTNPLSSEQAAFFNQLNRLTPQQRYLLLEFLKTIQ